MEKLAICGGNPTRITPFHPWPVWGPEEENNLTAAATEGVWGTIGKRAMAFAGRFAEYVGAARAIPVSSGTLALETALRGLGAGPGDEVVVPAYTFAATLSSAAITGARPVLADVDPDHGNILPSSVDALMSPKTKAVVAVHIAGYPCDMDALIEITRRRGVPIVEDASHAHGAALNGRRVGSLGTVGCFSFQRSKNLTCGEGGLVATSDEDIFRACWQYHHSGRAWEGAGEFVGQIGPGTNARMTEWQAAVLDAQMNRLDSQNARRTLNAAYLRRALSNVGGLILPSLHPSVTVHAYHLFPMRLADDCPRDDIVGALRAEGIPVSAGYPGPEALSFLRRCGVDPSSFDLRNTRSIARSAIWLHGSVLLGSLSDMDDIIAAFIKVLPHYGG